eukprot:CAMPEP_0185256874 /NCGR_PEP_ID=MMETSP1359-20130426/5942_1 /TAXON_ID=552665 /ORGANISM="Bigelowiella longifila, Strain CCMP242" /LENGTH=110 /DNA_ID=CAMNT_0027841665 /DNA_START=269 /DNA_END=601 /DNA_ORIENTATION=-
MPPRAAPLRKRASMPILSHGGGVAAGGSHIHMEKSQHKRRSLCAFSEEPTRKGPGIIRREDEEDDYWMSKDERDGKSPLEDPLAWSAIAGLVVPFTILGIAIATGYVPIG